MTGPAICLPSGIGTVFLGLKSVYGVDCELGAVA